MFTVIEYHKNSKTATVKIKQDEIKEAINNVTSEVLHQKCKNTRNCW